MSEDNVLKFEDFYNISIKSFYELITEIMHDFHFAVHRTVSESQGKRRIELWRSSKNENDNALIWVELIENDEDIDPYISTDILRTMNEENVTKLFFFTNGLLDKKEREILDVKDHYLFTPTDIIETLNALEKKKLYKHQKKRKMKGVPSGYTLLKNFLKNKQIEKASVHVPTGKIVAVAEKYSKMVHDILDEVDRIEDLNNITPLTKEKFKKIQHDVLSEITKISILNFGEKFADVKIRLFSLFQYTLVYIGAVIEYESEDEMKRSRTQVESELAYLDGLSVNVNEYKAALMGKGQKTAIKLLYTSFAIIVFFLTFLFIMLNEKQ